MVRTYRPQSFQEALEIKKGAPVITIAGGTDLMVKRKKWAGLLPCFEVPAMFIAHLGEMKGVRLDGGNIRIGAACSFALLLQNEAVPQILKTAVSRIASPAVRNMGTIGGNICNASPAGDTLPGLYALDASVVLKSIDRERILKIGEFITAPGETVLREDELLKEIVIPEKPFGVNFYRKVGTGMTNTISKITFTGIAETQSGRVKDIRITFGAVAPTVVQSRANEERLIGHSGKEIEKMIPEISSLYSALINPIDDQRSNAFYRRSVSLRLLGHFLRALPGC